MTFDQKIGILRQIIKKVTLMSEIEQDNQQYDAESIKVLKGLEACLLYTSPSPRDPE